MTYAALGSDGFVALTAITAASSILGSLNLGIGGALVAPMAEASSRSDTKQEALVMQAGFAPLVAMFIFVALFLAPLILYLPMSWILGSAGSHLPTSQLRGATAIAAMCFFVSMPLTLFESLRQAYQETHVVNAFGIIANLLTCVGLVFASSRNSSIVVFVSILGILPVMCRLANAAHLLAARPYLIVPAKGWTARQSMEMARNGLKYVSSSLSYFLIYQWPLYWTARHASPDAASVFAISLQLGMLAISFGVGFVQPIWSSVADAKAKGDWAWIGRCVMYSRCACACFGLSIMIAFVPFGNELTRLWLRRTVVITLEARISIALYIVLAIWENLHYITSLGLGHLGTASTAVFKRCLVFAILLPPVFLFGGTLMIWVSLCTSIIAWTGWKLPNIVSRSIADSDSSAKSLHETHSLHQ